MAGKKRASYRRSRCRISIIAKTVTTSNSIDLRIALALTDQKAPRPGSGSFFAGHALSYAVESRKVGFEVLLYARATRVLPFRIVSSVEREISVLIQDLPVALYVGQPYCVKPFLESRANAAQAPRTYLIVASCAFEL
jgi:hypothetical protein